MKKIIKKTTSIFYFDKCDICNKKISGASEKLVKFNSFLHKKQKHKNKENGK